METGFFDTPRGRVVGICLVPVLLPLSAALGAFVFWCAFQVS